MCHLVDALQLVDVVGKKHVRPAGFRIFLPDGDNVHVTLVVVGFAGPKVLIVKRPVLGKHRSLVAPLGVFRREDELRVDSCLDTR